MPPPPSPAIGSRSTNSTYDAGTSVFVLRASTPATPRGSPSSVFDMNPNSSTSATVAAWRKPPSGETLTSRPPARDVFVESGGAFRNARHASRDANRRRGGESRDALSRSNSLCTATATWFSACPCTSVQAAYSDAFERVSYSSSDDGTTSASASSDQGTPPRGRRRAPRSRASRCDRDSDSPTLLSITFLASSGRSSTRRWLTNSLGKAGSPLAARPPRRRRREPPRVHLFRFERQRALARVPVLLEDARDRAQAAVHAVEGPEREVVPTHEGFVGFGFIGSVARARRANVFRFFFFEEGSPSPTFRVGATRPPRVSRAGSAPGTAGRTHRSGRSGHDAARGPRGSSRGASPRISSSGKRVFWRKDPRRCVPTPRRSRQPPSYLGVQHESDRHPERE